MTLEKWKLAELSTFFVERALAGSADVSVEHDAHIADRVNGELRQVDVAVRYSQGGHPYLRTVEVQNREKTKIGVPFIDQVATKADRIGAHRTSLVSVAGFTKTALARISELPHLLDASILQRVPEDAVPPFLAKAIPGSAFDAGRDDSILEAAPQTWIYRRVNDSEFVRYVTLYDFSLPGTTAAAALVVDASDLKSVVEIPVTLVALVKPGSQRQLGRLRFKMAYDNGETVVVTAVERAPLVSCEDPSAVSDL